MSHDTGWNQKDERIRKLWRRGVPIPAIARKLGMPGNEQRVVDGLKRLGLLTEEEL